MDAIKNYKCPCCNAPLVFEPNTQGLHCESCGNAFTLDVILQMSDDESLSAQASKYDWEHYEPRNYQETNEITLTDYNCPSCGAKITGDDTMGSTICPYCGNSTIVKGQFEGTLMPDYIIPFKIDKKAAVKAFENHNKTAPFLPDAFQDQRKIDEMAGIYVPFWMFDCDCEAAITYNASKTTIWSDANYDYTKTDHFRLFRSGSIGFANIPVDGSKKADDAYMEALEPYIYQDAVDFHAAFLSGYLADKYDVTVDESIERANERVKNSVIEAFGETTENYSAVYTENTRISFSEGKIRYALLPVWMLNIKYNGQIYHFAINGQTGKVVGSYPVDNSKKRKYFLKVAGIAYITAAVIAFWLLH